MPTQNRFSDEVKRDAVNRSIASQFPRKMKSKVQKRVQMVEERQASVVTLGQEAKCD